MKGFTDKQRRFIDSYTGNIEEAAKIAKLSYGYCRILITKPSIVLAIQARSEKRNVNAPHISNRQQRQQFWSDTMNDTEIDMKDRLRSSELLGKSEKDFVDRVELTGQDGGAVKYESMSDAQIDIKIAAMLRDNLDEI